MLALISPKSGGRSVGIVRLWTEAMEFSSVFMFKPFKSNFIDRTRVFMTEEHILNNLVLIFSRHSPLILIFSKDFWNGRQDAWLHSPSLVILK
jgi:hypothetical protein